MTYDVLVAGASFAGLAVVHRVRARVLLVDRHPVGTHQTSACAAPLSLLRAMGAEGAVQQVHQRIVIHTPWTTSTWPLPEPFCTFDYRTFCVLALRRAQVEFVQASVQGIEAKAVLTSAGAFRARLMADCTGWRAVLARAVDPGLRRRQWLGFGLETEVPYTFPEGLHFFFDPEVAPDGYAWAFPCGRATRFGVLSYRGRTRVREAVDRFVGRFGVRPAGYHGGYLSAGAYDPVVGDVFVVGDAAGHCLPLTGEGIRPAVHAGWMVGELFQWVLEGRCTLRWARDRYRAYVASQRRRVGFLALATLLALRLPPRALALCVAGFSRPSLRHRFLVEYLATFGPPQPSGILEGRAGVAELADAVDSNSTGPKGRVGSTPTPGTRADSSAGEHVPYKDGVAGSSPAPPTR